MKISVLIPTLNRPDYLREALASVAAQTLAPYEVVVSDNHSRTVPTDVIAEFPQLPIRLVQPPVHVSMEEHWQWAFRQPQGEWIALLEDDNLWRPDHLASLAEGVKTCPQVGLVGTATVMFDSLIKPIHLDVFAPPWKYNLLTEAPVLATNKAALAAYVYSCPFASSATMISTEVFKKVNPISDYKGAARDRLLFAQIAAESGAAFVPRRTVLYRAHASQAVGSFNGATYRKFAVANTEPILALVYQKGWTAESVAAELRPMVPEHSLEAFAVEVLRTREKSHIKTLLPPLKLKKQRLAAALTGLAAGKLAQRLGRILKK